MATNQPKTDGNEPVGIESETKNCLLFFTLLFFSPACMAKKKRIFASELIKNKSTFFVFPFFFVFFSCLQPSPVKHGRGGLRVEE